MLRVLIESNSVAETKSGTKNDKPWTIVQQKARVFSPGSEYPDLYNLVLPEILYLEVEKLAENRGTTVVEVLRKFIKLGLLAAKVEETDGSALLIREGDITREIILL